MDKKEKNLFYSLFLMIAIIIFLSVFIFQSEPNAEEIKDRFIDSVGNLKSYKFLSNTRIIRTTENITGVNSTKGNLITTVKIDMSKNKFFIDSSLVLDTPNNQNSSITYYYEDKIFYLPWGENKWRSSDLENNWYGYSFVERLAYFLLEDANLEKLENEKIDGKDCYVLNIKPKFENIHLNKATGDLLFESSISEESYDNLTMKCWIDKNDFYLKKILVNYDLDISSFYKNDENITNVIQSYDIDIQLYDYNKAITISAPWQQLLEEAEEELCSLEYSSIKYGYGFNLNENWTGWIEFDYAKSQFLYRKDVDSNNLSLVISPPSEYDSSSLDEAVTSTLENLDNNNITIISNTSRTLNNMNAYEIVYSTTNDDSEIILIKNIYVENNGRIFNIFYGGLIDLYNLYDTELEQSLNASFTIISPYYQII